jgi:hypothetical protein
MANLNEEFLQIFEAIKRTVNRIADREDSQDFELSAATGTSYLVRNRNAELRYIRDIRNAIGHPQHSSKTPAFVVTEGFLASCRGVLHGISKAARASDLGIKKTDLYFANWDTLIHPLITIMREQRFSHIPILDEEGVLMGVFNESAILDYLVASGMASLIEPDQNLADIRDHCCLGADHTETFRFVDHKATEDDVADIFLTVEGRFTRVGAVFVTPGAAPNQPIQRMITAWDVLSQRDGGR